MALQLRNSLLTFIILLSAPSAFSQLINSSQGVNWVGQINGYTEPANLATDYRVLTYRKVNTTTSNPFDGRGQWVNTVNVQASGGNVPPLNMTGGTNAGFLFTSGPTGNQFQNKWAFTSNTQATLNAINTATYQGSNDRGINMSAVGRYTFVLKDNGNATSGFYVGFTTNAPVTMTHSPATQLTVNNDRSATILVTLSAAKSSQENVFVRYKLGNNDFSTGTSTVSAAGTLVSGNTYSVAIPAQTIANTVYYYAFTSTMTTAALNALSEGDKSYALLNYADNSGNDYSYFLTSSFTSAATGNYGTAATWVENRVPFDGSTVTIANGHNVTTNIASAPASVVINPGGTLTLSNAANFGSVFTTALTVNGTLLCPATVTSAANGMSAQSVTIANGGTFTNSAGIASAIDITTFNVNNGGTYNHDAVGSSAAGASTDFAGTARTFGASSNTVITKWGNSTTTSPGGFLPNNMGNVTINIPSLAGSWNMTGTITTIQGNLIIQATGGTVREFRLSGTAGGTLSIGGGNPNSTGILNVQGDFSISAGTLLKSDGVGTINFTKASGPQNVSVSASSISTDAISFNAGTGTSTNTVLVNSNFPMNAAGVLAVASNARLDLTGNNIVTGGTLTTVAGSTLGIGSTAGITSSGATGNVQTTTRTYATGANYVYIGTANQGAGNGLPATVATLTINNTGTSPTNVVTLAANTTISAATNSLRLQSGKLDLNTKTLNIPTGGTVVSTGGDFTATAGPLNFAGTGTVTGTLNFPTVTMSGGVNFGSSSNIVTSLQLNSGSFINTNPATYGNGSTLIYNNTGTFGRSLEWSALSGAGYPYNVQVQNGTTVDLSANGFADRAIAGNLSLGLNGAASAGSLSMGSTTNKLSVAGNVMIGGNTSGTSTLTLSSAIGGDIYVTGNWDVKTNGVFAPSLRAVFFEGAGTSVVTTIGTATFDYLRINKTSAGTVSQANDLIVNSNLTLNAQLVTNAFKATVAAAATLTANAGGWVKGNLQKTVATGTNTVTFEVGDSLSYTPVTTAYAGVTTSGTNIVRTDAGDHPSIAGSGINSALSVNRYYTITNGGVAGGSYSPVFTFVAGDIDSGANTANFVVRRYSGATWFATATGVRTALTTQATGLSAFGEFQIGEAKLITVATQPADVLVCSTGGTSFSSTSTSTPAPTIQWQRGISGVYTNITALLDGGVYSGFNSTTLTLSNTTGLNGYTYQAVFTNVNGSATSSAATLTVNPASVAGSISGAGAVCTGTNSTTLTLAGNTGTIQWQVSTNGGVSYSDLTGQTASTYTANNLTSTTYYRAVVTSGVCSSATSAPVSITVNPTSVAGTISGAGTVCSGTNSTTLTLSGNTGTIQWQVSTNGGVSYSDLTGQTASTYTANNLTSTTYYRAVVTSGVCSSATSAPVSITVNPASVAGTISGAGPVCSGTNSTTLTLSGNTGGIQWQVSTNGGVSYSDLTGQTASTYTANNLTATTYYRAVVTSGVCSSATSAPVSITVNPTSVAGTISGAGTVCSGTNSTTLTLSGNTGTIQWQVSTNGGVSYSDLTGQTASTYTANNLTATTYYRAVVTSGVCSSATSAPVSITVNPTSVAGTISGAGTVCSGTNSTTLTLSGNTGTIQWQSSADGVTYSNLAGQTASAYTATNLTATTYYQAVVTSGVCASAATAPATITVNPTSVAGTISGAGTVCSGTNSTTLTLSGNTGTIQWQSSADGVTYSNLTGETGSTYTATNLTATTYYQAVVTSGVCASAATTPVTITVNPTSVAGTISGAGTVCSGTNSTTLTLSGNTGTIQWQLSIDGGATYSDISGATASTYTATNLTATTYYLAVVTSGVCASATTTPVTITVNPTSVAGTISGAGTVCSGTNSTTLTLSGNTGTIQWQSSADGVTYSNLTGETGSTYTATNLTATTYYQAVVTSGVCASAMTTPVTIIVSATSVAGTVSADQPICSGTQPSDITLSGSTGSIQWQSSTDNMTFTNISGETAATLTGASIGVLTSTTYFRAIVTSGSCASATSSVVTVTVGVSTTWNGTSWSNGTPNGSMGIIITGNYTSSGNLSGCSLYITNNATVTISAGDDMTLNSSVTVDAGSDLIVSNTSNLIQLSNASNIGSISVECDSNPLMRLDYTMWSTPVAGQNLLAFSPATLTNRFYTYNPSTDLYNAVADPFAIDFSVGTGYLIRVPNTWPTTPTVWNGVFEGTPNNGDVSLTVTSGTYNGVGNPYPSAIDADAFITDNSLTEALYFWRKTNNSANTSYATYTLAGGAGTSPNSGGDPGALIPNGTIMAGQGFIAKSTSTAFSFTNSMRTGDNGGQFFRASSVDRNRIWLNLTNSDGVYSQSMVAYMAGATMGLDPAIDGKYFNDSENALTSLIDGVEYAVQGRALPFDGTDIVPLGFKVVTAGTYAINLDHADGLFAEISQGIYLKDHLLNVTHDLRSGAYSFTTEAGAANDRFEIVYTPQLSTTEVAWDASQVIVYKDKQDIVINTGKVTMGNVRIFDIRGRLLMAQDHINASEVRMNPGTTQQVLIVRITTDDNRTVSKKVVN